MAVDPPVVIALGAVDPALVTGVLGDGVSFVADPTAADLDVAVGAIARADAVVDSAFFERTPRLRVLARTGVGVDLVDLSAATARESRSSSHQAAGHELWPRECSRWRCIW